MRLQVCKRSARLCVRDVPSTLAMIGLCACIGRASRRFMRAMLKLGAFAAQGQN
jgi:hypothetical protein